MSAPYNYCNYFLNVIDFRLEFWVAGDQQCATDPTVPLPAQPPFLALEDKHAGHNGTSPSPENTNHNEIIGIQAIRFVAALSVLVDHYVIHLCKQGALPQSWLPLAYRLGALGVFVFFAISGFVMVLSNRNKFQVQGSPFDFFFRRVLRIWPMYFLATVLVFAMKHTDPLNNIQNMLKSLAFIPYIGEEGLYRPVLGKGWTLNYEMFFYGVFALCLSFPKKIGLGLACAVLVVMAVAGGASDNLVWKFYANNIVLFFLVGVAVGYMVTEIRIRWPHSRNAGTAIVLAVIVFVAMMFTGRVSGNAAMHASITLLGVFVCLYLVCFADSRFRNPALAAAVATLGDASYCLYLFHGFVLAAFRIGLGQISDAHPIMLLPVVVVAAVAFCVLIHLYAEKPLNAFLVKAYKNRRVGSGQPALLP
jgi:exopolysaccharide production protein ExoZ